MGTIFFDLLNKTRQEVKASFNMREKFSWRSGLFKLSDSLFAITGQEKGFYLLKYNEQTNRYDIDPHLYFENYFCSFILTDKNNRLWIGTNKGLFRENKSAGDLETITVPQKMNPYNLDLSIRSIAVANNKLFLATSGEGLLIVDKTTLKPLKKIAFRHTPAAENVAYYVIVVNNDTVLAGGRGSLFYINTHTLVHTDARLPGWTKEKDWVASLFKD